MASYPTSVKTFTTRVDGNTITPAFFNDPQDEITAVQSGLLNGLAHSLIPATDAVYSLGDANHTWLLNGHPFTGKHFTFVPSWVNLTLGNANHAGAWVSIGKLFFWEAVIVWGTTTAVTNNLAVVLPFTGYELHRIAAQTHGHLFDTSAGHTYPLKGLPYLTTAVGIGLMTNPLTWVHPSSTALAVGDVISIGGWYQVA